MFKPAVVVAHNQLKVVADQTGQETGAMRPKTTNRNPRYVLTAEMTMIVALGAMRLFRVHSLAEKAVFDAAKLEARYNDTASQQGAANRLGLTVRPLHHAALDIKPGDL